jgi:hypothetical protein
MPSIAFDAFTRSLAQQQAAFAPIAAEGRNRNKKRNKKNGGNQKKLFALCTSQVPACEALVQDNCNDDAACVAATAPCCNFLASCDFAGFIACISDANAS